MSRAQVEQYSQMMPLAGRTVAPMPSLTLGSRPQNLPTTHPSRECDCTPAFNDRAMMEADSAATPLVQRPSARSHVLKGRMLPSQKGIVLYESNPNNLSWWRYARVLVMLFLLVGWFYILAGMSLYCAYQTIFHGSLICLAILIVTYTSTMYPSQVLWQACIDSSIWKDFCDYFSFRVIIENPFEKYDVAGGSKRKDRSPSEGELDKPPEGAPSTGLTEEFDFGDMPIYPGPDDHYLFLEFPHGVYPIGFMLSATIVQKLFSGMRVEGAVASILFKIPLLGHLCHWFGARAATKANVEKMLTLGSAGVMVGGIAEIFLSKREREIIYLKRRSGVFELALKHGASLVPVYHFGNTQLLDFVGLSGVSRLLRMSLLLFYGRWGLPIPRPHPLTMAIGFPIDVEKVENPTKEQIQALNEEFQHHITRVFDLFKPEMGWEHKELKIV